MNVKQLIEKLQDLPQDSIVVVRGYEGGVDEITEISVSKVALNINSEWYYGKHELICGDYDEKVFENNFKVAAVWVGT